MRKLTIMVALCSALLAAPAMAIPSTATHDSGGNVTAPAITTDAYDTASAGTGYHALDAMVGTSVPKLTNSNFAAGSVVVINKNLLDIGFVRMTVIPRLQPAVALGFSSGADNNPFDRMVIATNLARATTG